MSQDHATALQPGQQSEALSPNNNNINNNVFCDYSLHISEMKDNSDDKDWRKYFKVLALHIKWHSII